MSHPWVSKHLYHKSKQIFPGYMNFWYSNWGWLACFGYYWWVLCHLEPGELLVFLHGAASLFTLQKLIVEFFDRKVTCGINLTFQTMCEHHKMQLNQCCFLIQMASPCSWNVDATFWDTLPSHLRCLGFMPSCWTYPVVQVDAWSFSQVVFGSAEFGCMYQEGHCCSFLAQGWSGAGK